MLNVENFFNLDNKSLSTNTKNSILQRKRRNHVLNLAEAFEFNTGDIVVVVYWKDYIVYRFEGLCIAIKKKSLKNLDVSLVLRNVILGVGVEVTVSYFFNRVYNLSLSDYKRKDFFYKRSKLFYVRQRMNKASRIK